MELCLKDTRNNLKEPKLKQLKCKINDAVLDYKQNNDAHILILRILEYIT